MTHLQLGSTASRPTKKAVGRSLFVLSVLLTCVHPLHGQKTEEGMKKTIEAVSPDGQFGFRVTGESSEEKQTYDLIDRKSGKVVMSVVESDPDFGPSARFSIKALWRRDSKAFAITAYLQKRGSELLVYVRHGSTFRAIELPELEVEIPEKLEQGKTTGINSQTAKRWQKDGSLVVEIETTSSGNGGTATATRTVVLAFDKSDKASIRSSSVKVRVDKGDE